MTKPNIQVDDEVREMTDDEYAAWLETTNEPSRLYPTGETQE